MKQQTDRSPVSGALPPPVAVNLNQVPGCQARRAVTGLLFFYAAWDLFTTCDSLHLSVRASFRRSTRSGSASTTQTEHDAANEQQTLLPGHAGADEHRGNDYEQCCHLVSQNGPLLFCLLAEQQGDRWCESLCLSMARVDKLRPRIRVGNPASTFPHQAADRLHLRHETVVVVMNASLPFFANRLLLDDRLPVRQIGVCFPLRDHRKAATSTKSRDHRFALAGGFFAEFHLVRTRSLHQEVARTGFIDPATSAAFDTLPILGWRLVFTGPCRRLRR